MRTRAVQILHLASALAVAAAVVTVAAPADAGPAARQTVTAGNARFQVLSPTLIRTEYAGDGRFTDAATFNAVGRGSFTPPPFTSTTSNGVLTIRTSATTLTYKLDSGPFDSGNLQIRTTAGAAVTAAPWHHLTCATGALCEAEDLTADGLGVATDHTGYTGEGFLAGFESTGTSATADVSAAAAGTYNLTARYANGTGGDGQHVTRTLSVSVDGGAAQKLTLPTTADWDSWATASVPLTLSAGRHSVRLERTATDSGNVNLDALAVLSAGAPFPPSSARAFTGCALDVSCEAESGLRTGSAVVATDHAGYAGRGFVAELNRGSSLTHRVVEVPAAGTYQLDVRYANGTGGDGLHQTRTATVGSAGVTRTLSMPATANWDTWGTASVPVDLRAGTNDVVLGCPDDTSCHVNLDTVAVTRTGAAIPQPHLTLGGYRRGLDGVNGDNGTPSLTEGLLHHRRLVPARRQPVRAVRHRHREGDAAAVARREPLPGRLRLHLRPRLQGRAAGPGDPDRAVGTAAALGIRHLVLRVLRPHRGRLPRQDPAALPQRRRPAGRPGDRHRLQGAGHVERLAVRHGQVPGPDGVLRLVARRRACTTR